MHHSIIIILGPSVCTCSYIEVVYCTYANMFCFLYCSLMSKYVYIYCNSSLVRYYIWYESMVVCIAIVISSVSIIPFIHTSY